MLYNIIQSFYRPRISLQASKSFVLYNIVRYVLLFPNTKTLQATQQRQFRVQKMSNQNPVDTKRYLPCQSEYRIICNFV